ncbi:MAG: RsbRD N-terminal domain-containing protein [Deltaproteobacteria bacterium]
MNLSEFIKLNRDRILDAWFLSVANTYPAETFKFLTEKKDKFANPMGSTFREALPAILDVLSRTEEEIAAASSAVRDIVRIRAIQDFTPSAAVAPFYYIKGLVREFVSDATAKDPVSPKELDAFDARVNSLVFLAFDIYMECRETVWRVKYDEIMKRPFMVRDGVMCPSYLLKKGMSVDEMEKIGGAG